MSATEKTTRILMLYQMLDRGRIVNKAAFALENDISERTADRDISDIRNFLSETFSSVELVDDKRNGFYHFANVARKELSGAEALIIAKSLIRSRLLREDELAGFIDILFSLIRAKDQITIRSQISSELLSYQAPHHNVALMKIIWDLSQAIDKKRIIKVIYNSEGIKSQIIFFPYSIEISEGICYLVGLQLTSGDNSGVVMLAHKIDSFTFENGGYNLEQLEIDEVCEIISSIHSSDKNKIESLEAH